MVIMVSIIPRQISTAQASWQWYKTDTHIHSVVSADAYPDLGILTSKAKAAGFNAIFVTDHNLASDFPANGVANLVPFRIALHLFWSFGTQTAAVWLISPVNTGTSLPWRHLTGSAETATWDQTVASFGRCSESLHLSDTDRSGSGAYVRLHRWGSEAIFFPGYNTRHVISREDHD
jgi:hypothetical protein